MFDEFEKSVKAKLWEFKSTPFMSAFIVSLLYLNREYILLYYSGSINIERKLTLLEKMPIDFLHPLLLGTLYVFIYPVIFWGFYSFTLWMGEKHNNSKQKIQGHRLLSVDESLEISMENQKYKKEIAEYVADFQKKEDGYLLKIDTLQTDLQKQKESYEKSYERLQQNDNEKIAELEKKVQSYEERFQQDNEEKTKITAEVSILRKKLSEWEKNKPIVVKGKGIVESEKTRGLHEVVAELSEKEKQKMQTTIDSLTPTERVILHLFYKDHSRIAKHALSDILKKDNELPQGKIDITLKKLEKEILSIDNHGNYYLSDFGLELVNKIF